MRRARIRPAAAGDAVVVTGASSGMGEDAALFLNRPGAVATAMASHQRPELVPGDSLYPNQAVVAHRFMEGMAKHQNDPRCSPRRVSELVAKIIATERPRAHYPVGGGKRVLSLVGFMPEPLQARVVNRVLTHA